MNRLKKLLSVVLAAIMVLSLSATAFAAGNGEDDIDALSEASARRDEEVDRSHVYASGYAGESIITLTADAATFSVTVPTSIDFHINADGSVTAPTDVKLINMSTGAVQVTKIEVKEGSWALASYAEDLAKRPVNSNALAIQLKASNDTVATTKNGNQALAHNANEWVMAAKDHEGSTLALTCAAHASAVANSISGSTNAASVVFTIGWVIEGLGAEAPE